MVICVSVLTGIIALGCAGGTTVYCFVVTLENISMCLL